MKNVITDKLVSANKEKVEAALTELETLVNPNTPVLTPEERSHYAHASGNSKKLLVDDVQTITKSQPSLKSEHINWTDFESDLTASRALNGWIERTQSILYKLESAKLMHDYDNYMDAIDEYSHLEYLTRNGVQTAAEAHNSLKIHFKRAKSDKKKTEEPAKK